MFLNHRPLLVFLLFLASSPVDVVSRVLYSSSDSNLNEFPRNQTIDHLELDVNPLHLLCPVCSLLQGLVGGILKPILGGGLLKQIGILVCALGLSTPIKLMFVPNLICTVVFEYNNSLIQFIHNKKKRGTCFYSTIQMFLSSSLKSRISAVIHDYKESWIRALPSSFALSDAETENESDKKSNFSADEEYENHILSIIENKDSANLSPQMEFLFKEILKQLPMDSIESAGIADSVRHVTRNFVAALQYHLSHRDHYLAIVNQNG